MKEGTTASRALRVQPSLAIGRRLHFVWRYRGQAPGHGVGLSDGAGDSGLAAYPVLQEVRYSTVVILRPLSEYW
jgi:hypothetical protein